VGLERGPLSLVTTTEELLEIKRSGCLEIRDYGRRRSAALTMLSAKVSTNFVDKSLSLGRCSSLAHSGHGVYLFGLVNTISFCLLSLILHRLRTPCVVRGNCDAGCIFAFVLLLY
jgi:hypothetical protein